MYVTAMISILRVNIISTLEVITGWFNRYCPLKLHDGKGETIRIIWDLTWSYTELILCSFCPTYTRTMEGPTAPALYPIYRLTTWGKPYPHLSGWFSLQSRGGKRGFRNLEVRFCKVLVGRFLTFSLSPHREIRYIVPSILKSNSTFSVAKDETKLYIRDSWGKADHNDACDA